MKCPKCGYLGYERVERCRNCGYEFALGSSAPAPELRLRDNKSLPNPLDDLDLVDGATSRPADGYMDMAPPHAHAADTSNRLVELPLFGPPITDDVPLITKASPPRSPLSVRRSTPEVPRLRSEPRAPMLDWSESTPLAAAQRPSPARQSIPVVARPSRATIHETPPSTPAGFAPRALAAMIDVALLACVDLVVVYFTMKICRLSIHEAALLPKAPLLAFLLLQNAGYFIAFTTTGQTLGKMLTGVRVLADDSDSSPDVGRSAIRALFWLVLALPAGLGLLTATFSRDGRGLHDRFAGTRVVRAGV